MGHSGPVHFKSLERPISGRDGPHEARCNEISGKLHGVEGIELGRTRGFFEDFVDPGLQRHVEGLKKVFEQ